MLILLLLLSPGGGDPPPYAVSLFQERTLFARDEPVMAVIRLGNQSENPIKLKRLPDLAAHLRLRSGALELPPATPATKAELYRKLPQLEINAHRDFRIDLRRWFPELNQAGDYQLHYADEHAESSSKRFRVLDLDGSPLADRYRVRTSLGPFELQLAREDAPQHCAQFALLVAQNFYSEMIFHRVVRNQLIQSGDPLGNGMGGSGWPLMREISPFLRHEAGAVGMARGTDPDSAESQFYVCLEALPELNGQYTVFARVVAGMEVVATIAAVGTTGPHGEPPERPFEDVTLLGIDPLPQKSP